MIVIAAVMVRRKATPAMRPPTRRARRQRSSCRGWRATARGGFDVELLRHRRWVLIVPGLVAATKMPLPSAIGSSLVAVTAFGLTTAVSYALSGLLDWRLVALFVGCGFVGGIAGRHASRALAGSRAALGTVFAAIVAAVGIYIVARSIG